jgi:quercetin dioxygenase-like cupin family protein
MTIKLVALVLLCLMSGTAVAQEPKVTSLMSKDLPENPGREALMITVEHAPGGSSAIHRHNAHAFVYVLEGSVVMQLKGGQQVTLTPGQTFYEGPDDVHVVDRNASGTQPAKFLVLLIKDKGAPGARALTVTVTTQVHEETNMSLDNTCHVAVAGDVFRWVPAFWAH